MNAVLEKLDTLDDVREFVVAHGLNDQAKRVGKWIWLEFSGQPGADVRDELKAVGFRWNPKRSAWQHSCGNGRSRMAKAYHPKERYGSARLDD